MRLFSLLALSAFAQDYDYSTTVEAATEALIMADYVATTEEATTEEANTASLRATVGMANEKRIVPQDINGFARNGGSVNSLSNLQLSLLPNADFEFTWDYDATHSDYNFEYQELIGNYRNTTVYIQYSGYVTMATDGTKTTTTITPTYSNKIFRVCIHYFIVL